MLAAKSDVRLRKALLFYGKGANLIAALKTSPDYLGSFFVPSDRDNVSLCKYLCGHVNLLVAFFFGQFMVC